MNIYKILSYILLLSIFASLFLTGCKSATETTESSAGKPDQSAEPTTTGTTVPADIFALNEKGFFAEPFCKTISLNGTVKYAAVVMLFYVNLKEESKKTADSYAKVNDVYDRATLTFYPNGKMRFNYKLTDKLYTTFSERDLWPVMIPQQNETVLDYSIDLAKNEINLSDGSKFTLNLADKSITRSFILETEVYAEDGPVEGTAPSGEATSEQAKNFTTMKDVQYDSALSDDIAKMDVFVPDDLDKTKNNAAMFIVYGGGWTGGSKAGMEALAEPYARAGYVAVTMNLHNAFHNEATKKTEITVFDMLNDLHASVQKLKDLSDENGWNVTQCAVFGGSSGANLALTYAYSRGTDVPYFNTEEIIPVKFAVDLVGPVDMHDSAWYGDEAWEERAMMTVPGAGPLYAALLTGSCNDPDISEEEKEKYLNAMSPVWYVKNYQAVPTVMGYSKHDPIQNSNNGKILQGYLDEKSIRNDLFVFPNSLHSFSNDPELGKAFIDKSIEYAKEYFRG